MVWLLFEIFVEKWVGLNTENTKNVRFYWNLPQSHGTIDCKFDNLVGFQLYEYFKKSYLFVGNVLYITVTCTCKQKVPTACVCM